MRFVRVNATSDGDNTVVDENQVPEHMRIRVINYQLNVNAAGVITIQDSASSPTILAAFELLDSTGVQFNGTISSPAFDLPLGTGLEISNATGVDTFGHICYELV